MQLLVLHHQKNIIASYDLELHAYSGRIRLGDSKGCEFVHANTEKGNKKMGNLGKLDIDSILACRNSLDCRRSQRGVRGILQIF